MPWPSATTSNRGPVLVACTCRVTLLVGGCDHQTAASSLVGRVPCYLAPARSATTRNSWASTPTVDRDLAGVGSASKAGRPPLMIRCCEHNRSSDGGRRPQRSRRPCLLAGGPGGAAGPDRGPVRPGGATLARPGVGAGAAGGPATQELLDAGRARRGPQ